MNEKIVFIGYVNDESTEKKFISMKKKFDNSEKNGIKTSARENSFEKL